MYELNSVNSSNCQSLYLPPQEKNLINRLPNELLTDIFNLLDSKSITQVGLVNKRWEELAVDILKRKKFQEILELSKYINNNLDVFLDVVEKISSLVLKGHTILVARNVWQIAEPSYYALPIIVILKTIEKVYLRALKECAEQANPPNFFKDIFVFAKIYKKIDTANQKNDNEKSDLLRNICVKLIDYKQCSKAVEVAYTIPVRRIRVCTLTDIYKACAFGYICPKLVKFGYISKANKMAQDNDHTLINQGSKKITAPFLQQ